MQIFEIKIILESKFLENLHINDIIIIFKIQNNRGEI